MSVQDRRLALQAEFDAANERADALRRQLQAAREAETLGVVRGHWPALAATLESAIVVCRAVADRSYPCSPGKRLPMGRFTSDAFNAAGLMCQVLGELADLADRL